MIKIYDTTLRDGTQQVNMSLSAYDKLRIAKKLDEFGIHYIEGGWPGSNPKDVEFFQMAAGEKWKNAKIAAFCSTRYKNNKAEADPNLLQVVAAKTPVVTVFGKTWELHVTRVLETSLKENLKMIEDSVKFLKSQKKEVIFDAEHFFDGYMKNKEYALQCLEAAVKAGADNLSLCETNGGMMVSELKRIVAEVKGKFDVPLGIHVHNDSGLAVANSLAAVEEGAVLVQGTINGYGERCGNANLCVILPNLQLKMGKKILKPEKLKQLYSLCSFIQEIANQNPRKYDPYVGKYAFAHKGGVHASAMAKDKTSYQHIDPKLVGNVERITVSELSGKSNLVNMTKNMKVKFTDEQLKKALKAVKEKENEGYQYEGAEASFEMMLNRLKKGYKAPFQVIDFMVLIEQRFERDLIMEATVKIKHNGDFWHTAGSGNGPVNALDSAMRKSLVPEYPILKGVHLVDYKVRILDGKEGTAAKTRVVIESACGGKRWSTVGCSENIIEASMIALVDSLEYGIMMGLRSEK